MARDGRQVCLFAQFDPTNRIRPHVTLYLDALLACGFDVVMACSGTRLPPMTDREALYERGVTIVPRANRGHDFGAWRDLIRAGHADGADGVLLANDSVFGPFGDLGSIVGRMRRRGADVWGMIESRQHGWHLQSWFVHFSRTAFAEAEIRRVLEQPFERMSKDEIITEGELGLGRAIRAAGLRWDAVAKVSRGTLGARVRPINPMHLNWRSLLASGQVPFIKADLIRSNNMNIPWVADWAGLLARYHAPLGAISEYLFDYTGTQPDCAGQYYRPPVRRIKPTSLLGYVLLSKDRLQALRALADSLYSGNDAEA